MRLALPRPGFRRGISLVETMVSIGVLAVVAPLAIAALLRGGEGGAVARAETRAPVIVESCLGEIKTARDAIRLLTEAGLIERRAAAGSQKRRRMEFLTKLP